MVAKRALVVGVGPGLGSAVAYFLLSDGYEVLISSRNKRHLEIIKGSLNRYGKIYTVVADASLEEGSILIAKKAAECLKHIDALVITAGDYMPTDINKISDKEITYLFSVNFKSPLLLVGSTMHLMRSGSSVVLVSSVLSRWKESKGSVAYASTKAAVARLAEGLASELVKLGIRVNAVAPLSMKHDFKPGREWKKERKLGAKECPPEDVAAVVRWLCSDDSDWVDGAVIPVDGGGRFLDK